MRRALLPLLLAFSAVAHAQDPRPKFEVATVKTAPQKRAEDGQWSPPGRGRFEANAVTMTLLCRFAFGVDASQVRGLPAWAETELYDLSAKPEEGVALSRIELQPRLQCLLEDRFHLRAHREIEQQRGFTLVVARGGLKLQPSKAETFLNFRVDVNPGRLAGRNWTMAYLAQELRGPAGYPVVDRTGLTKTYDLDLHYAPELTPDSTLPSLFRALVETCGLKLEPGKVPAEIIVIDSVDRVPSAN